jgi:arsenite methyltransferase
VLDLGSGGGKLCYITAQLVGAEGHVIGVDCNTEMLALARRHQAEVARRIGFDNVSFRCGMIQDLQLDLELLANELPQGHPSGVEGILEQRQIEQRLRRESPLVPRESVDCVVSNCVLNLVRPEDRQQLFQEVFRVLKRGGRAAISDIVSDENVPDHLQADSRLWSGCISGAWREDDFLAEFERAGFHGMYFAKREEKPWQTVEGIEFRSATVIAYKGKEGPCNDHHEAVIYRGPFKRVTDDDGHVFERGQRTSVCRKTFSIMTRAPYVENFIPVEPHQEVVDEDAGPMDCNGTTRSPAVTKGKNYNMTIAGDDCCGSGGCC